MRNLIGFIGYSVCLLGSQNMMYLTLYFASAADVNAGVIITLWSIDPLMLAFFDRVVFKEKLKCYHIQGMVSILICSLTISLCEDSSTDV